MLFEISKNLGKSSVTHILLAEEQTKKKSKYIKMHYFGRCSSELAQLVPLPYS